MDDVNPPTGDPFETVNVAFGWPPAGTVAVYGAGCVAAAAVVGLLGAALPAWQASGREPYELVRGEGG